MRPFLKNLVRGSASESARLDELAQRLESRRALLEQLVERADQSIGQLQRLDAMADRVAAAEKQLSAVESQANALAGVESRLAGLAESHGRFDTRLADAQAATARLAEEITALRGAVADTHRLRGELEGFLGLDAPLRKAQHDADAIARQLEGQRADLGVLRQEHELALGQQRAAGTRLESFMAEWERASSRLGDVENRLAGLEQLSADLAPTTETIAQAKRQLAQARASADQIGQKMAVLDQQRDTIDEAMAKLDRLTAIVAQADAGLERHAKLARDVIDVSGQLESIAANQGTLLAQTREAQEQLHSMTAARIGAERSLVAMQERLDRQAERLASEERSLETIGQRSGGLKKEMADAGRALEAIAEQNGKLAAATAQADTLGSQVSSLTAELGTLSDLAGQLTARWEEARRLQTRLDDLAAGLSRVEEARPALDAAVRDLALVMSGREGIQHALEQIRTGREEIVRAENELRQTGAFVADTRRAVTSLRDDVAGLDRMRATVDGLRQEVEQLTAAQDVLASRREHIEDVQQRVAVAIALGSTLDERSRSLGDRLTGAEDQLAMLVPRFDEVGRAASRLVSLAAEARALEQRVAVVDKDVGALEERTSGWESLASRVEAVARDVSEREDALQRAASHLERATALRLEAAEAAESLTRTSREVAAQLGQADERLGTLNGLSRELEAKIAGLASIQERIGRFEARLAEWRGVEQQVADALENATSRRATIAALEGEIRGLYELASRVLGDARAVAEAEPQWARARGEVDAALARLTELDRTTRMLESRYQQLEKVEERLAYADALLDDLRGALEVLVAEKAQVDHLFDKAAALPLEIRRVEALIEILREERRVSERVRSAVADIRRREGEHEVVG